MRSPAGRTFAEQVRFEGHLIDSLILTKALDRITEEGGRFTIENVLIGHREKDPSRAVLNVSAGTRARLESILKTLQGMGARRVAEGGARLARAPRAGVFPEAFYATTNLETEVRLGDRWVRATRPEMDCGLRVDPGKGRVEPVRFSGVRKGDLFVVGHDGVRVTPLERPRARPSFEFMTSDASTEKPKASLIAGVAREIRQLRRSGRGRILVVAGPAVVHTGSREDMSWLIENGFVDVFFAGNALAVHDIEADFFGTSLGLSLRSGRVTRGGHENHLRAINEIRRMGSIREAVRRRRLRGGIMASLVRKKIPFVLAGSIRDDGPLPETIVDCLESQRVMREHLRGVEMALLLATALHSVATGNLLPGRVRTVCVDMNPSSVTKLNDRGTLQSMGLVTDAGYFLRELRRGLAR